MKKLLAAVVALLLLAAGALLAALGGVGLAVFGTQGEYRGTVSTVSSADASLALVIDLAGVDIGMPYHERLGEAGLSASSLTGEPLFIGRADQAAVDTYLFGVPYDLATKNGTWSTAAVPGIEPAVALPADQSFWDESSTGAQPAVSLDASGAPATLVVMNADASAGVAAELTLVFTGERIFAYSSAAIAAGLLLVVLAMAILFRGRRKRRRNRAAAAAGVDLSAQQPETDQVPLDEDVVDGAAVPADDTSA